MSFAGQSHSYCLFSESMHCGWTGVEEKEPCLQIKLYMEKWNFWLTWILALWLGIPEDKEINTAMQDKEPIRCKCEKNILLQEYKKFHYSPLVKKNKVTLEILLASTHTFSWIRLVPVLTCNHSVDTFIQQRHGGGTVREENREKKLR